MHFKTLLYFIILTLPLLSSATDKSTIENCQENSSNYHECLIQNVDNIALDTSYDLDHYFKLKRVVQKITDIKTQIKAYTALSKFEMHRGQYNQSIKSASIALNIYEQNEVKDPGLLAQIHHKFSHSLNNLGAYTSSIHHRKIQKKIIEKHVSQFEKRNYFLNQMIALNYLKINHLDSALHYFKEANVVANQMENNELIGSSLNDQGLIFYEKGDIDQAQSLFDQALTFLLKIQPKDFRAKILIGTVKGNIALCLPALSKEAERLMRENIKAIKENSSLDDLAASYIQMAETLNKNKRHHEALQYLDSAFSMENIPSELHLLGLEQKTIALIQMGQKFSALESYIKYKRLNDSLYGKHTVNQIINTHSNYALEKAENELIIEKINTEKKNRQIEILEQEKEISTLRNIILIISIISVVIVALLFIYKLRSDHKKKRAEQQLRNQLLEIDNKNKQERLTQSVLGLERKKDFAEEVLQKIKEFESIDKRDQQQIQLFIQNELDIDETQIEMEDFIQNTGSQFIAKLQHLHPDLTDNDIKMVFYIHMNLTLKQIAIIKNITPESVKIAKNRLSKKLNLENASDIQDYLQNL